MLTVETDRISELVRDAMILLETADQANMVYCPEGVALLEHYRGLVRAAHVLAKKGERSIRDLEELQSEILKALIAWGDHRELRPAGDPDFEALLKFHRQENQ